jgi:thymidylate synthase (FAD)
MKVTMIGKTTITNPELVAELQSNTSEQLIMYCARVSNPNNQLSGKPGLLKYCLDAGHVSIFEMSDMIVEIETSRAIAAQILRHWSFSFQEFSQRYAAVSAFETYEARRQDDKNRQNSVDDMSEEDKQWFKDTQLEVQEQCERLYNHALGLGIAKEQARFLLPLSTRTKLYMKGNLRDWINYLNLRTGNGTQKEHQDIANEIKKIFVKEFPIMAEALKW